MWKDDVSESDDDSGGRCVVDGIFSINAIDDDGSITIHKRIRRAMVDIFIDVIILILERIVDGRCRRTNSSGCDFKNIMEDDVCDWLNAPVL